MVLLCLCSSATHLRWLATTKCFPQFASLRLRETIRRFRIPPQPFLSLLRAFEQDQRVKEYQTFEQLLGYCRYSANPVGHLVLYLCEAYSTENAALSDHV